MGEMLERNLWKPGMTGKERRKFLESSDNKASAPHGSDAWCGNGNYHASGLSVLLWINPI